MTLSSLLSHDSPAISNYNLPPVPDVDRTHWKGGGWKGGKGNPNAALSALTLLAFLFFLNILQSCLRDTIQNNGMMVMVLPANSTATTRIKREVDICGRRQEDDSLKPHYHNWTDFDISNLVHMQVESYWSSKGNKARNNPLNSLQTKSKQNESNMNKMDQRKPVKHRISTKLILNKDKDHEKLNTTRMIQTKPDSLNTKIISRHSVPVAIKDNQLDTRFWTKTTSLFINNSIPYLRKIICCSNICKEANLLSTKQSSRESLIRKTKHWFCKSVRTVCGYYLFLCQN